MQDSTLSFTGMISKVPKFLQAFDILDLNDTIKDLEKSCGPQCLINSGSLLDKVTISMCISVMTVVKSHIEAGEIQ